MSLLMPVSTSASDRGAPRPDVPAGHPDRADRPDGALPFVLVAGIPGAGKTTVLARVAQALPDVRIADPECYRRALAARAGGLAYRRYRPLVHTLHGLDVLGLLLAGPGRVGGRALVVHEPGTRPLRNRLLATLARWRGWRTVLVVVDVPRDAALAGQRERGRVVRSSSFEAHWQRWTEQRDRVARAARAGQPLAGWRRVRLVGRDDAERVLRAELERTAT